MSQIVKKAEEQLKQAVSISLMLASSTMTR